MAGKRVVSEEATTKGGGGGRDRLLQAAAELFATKGFHGTGMSDLERATGLGRGGLYYHIPSKEELLFEVTSRYLHELIDAGRKLVQTPMPAEERLRRLSHIVMQAIVTRLAEMTVCFREVHSITGPRRVDLEDLHRRYEQVWADVLQAGVDEGVFCTADSLAVKAILGMHHYSYLWIRPGGPRTPFEIADLFSNLAISGLTTRR
jgi:AcrR family transcriptional regulator